MRHYAIAMMILAMIDMAGGALPGGFEPAEGLRIGVARRRAKVL